MHPLCYHNIEHLRIGCDLVNVYFIVDEYTNVEDEAATKGMVDITIGSKWYAQLFECV